MPKRLAYYCVFFLLAMAVGGGWLFYKNNVNITYGAPKMSKDEILRLLAVADENAVVSIFADVGIPIRQIAVGDDGWIFVGSRADKVLALRDADNDGEADVIKVVAERLSAPHGVAYHQGDLYIGATPTIYVVRDILRQLDKGANIALLPLIAGLPTSGHHGLRHLGIGPDGMLYVSFGVPCNICEPPSAEFTGVIRRYPLSGGVGEVYARGIRNAVGFDFHPISGELWFTDNGRDFLGDDFPNDELNRATSAGEHFGYPRCHDANVPDPEFGDGVDCDDYTPPVLLTGPHVANLGMTFSADGRQAYIALHGSWNRSRKIGYAVHRAELNAVGEVVKYAPFVTGWLRPNEGVNGRPVDVAFDEKGTLLISDDFAGIVYRVSAK